MKKKIKIDFSDFWGGFDKTNNYFYNILKIHFFFAQGLGKGAPSRVRELRGW